MKEHAKNIVHINNAELLKYTKH